MSSSKIGMDRNLLQYVFHPRLIKFLLYFNGFYNKDQDSREVLQKDLLVCNEGFTAYSDDQLSTMLEFRLPQTLKLIRKVIDFAL